MNGLASECSSGCESGWTMYLDQPDYEVGVFTENYKEKEAKEEDEEDLSMVSDASSGPPHLQEDEDYFDENGNFCSASSAAALVKKSWKKQRTDKHRQRQQQHSSLLDDTASSPVFSFSKQHNFALINNQASKESILDFSQGFSATHYKGKSAQFSFLKTSMLRKPRSTKPAV